MRSGGEGRRLCKRSPAINLHVIEPWQHTTACLRTTAVLYQSDSYSKSEWEDVSSPTCDLSVGPGASVGFAFLVVLWSVVTLGVLACPGCHCIGLHEPGRCCAHCVDQSVDEDGSSKV